MLICEVCLCQPDAIISELAARDTFCIKALLEINTNSLELLVDRRSRAIITAWHSCYNTRWR